MQERLGEAVPDSPPLAGAARRPDFCAVGCCVNSRVTRPTTAAQDSAADWAGLGIDPARLVASGIRGVVSDAPMPAADRCRRRDDVPVTEPVLRIGTRGSALALAQSGAVGAQLVEISGGVVDLVG